MSPAGKAAPCFCGELPGVTVRRNLTLKYTEIEVRCPNPDCAIRPRVLTRRISRREAVERWNTVIAEGPNLRFSS